jgi:hypothetical protein
MRLLASATSWFLMTIRGTCRINLPSPAGATPHNDFHLSIYPIKKLEEESVKAVGEIIEKEAKRVIGTRHHLRYKGHHHSSSQASACG